MAAWHRRHLARFPDGGTRVTFSLNANLRGPQKLMAPMVGKSMRNQVAALDDLKRVLES